MSPGPSLAGRAVTALLLTIGFYVLALGIAAGFALLGYFDVVGGHPSGRVLFFCAVTCGIILWSVLPRIDRFPDPGVRLTAAQQPELHQLVREVAAATQQAPPAEVFLVGDVNAFVAQRGGLLGIGSRRVMGIGLPLLQVLNVQQLRAVLAHEFGHYHGGDTRLGPWIYKTRAAIGRVIGNLAKADSLLKLPFQWYGMLFLRITHAISRRQELAADALSVRVVGREPVLQALQTVDRAAPLFGPYIESEFLPMLQGKVRPPLAAGFGSFLGSSVAKRIGAAIAGQAPRQSNPYDTHPPLAERLAAARQVAGAGEGGSDVRPAVALLRDLERLEAEVVAFQLGNRELLRFPAIGWEDSGQRVLAPLWEKTVREHGAALPAVTLGRLDEVAGQLRRVAKQWDAKIPEDQQEQAGAWLCGCAVAHALVGAGFAVHNRPGETIRLQRGEHAVEPFDLLPRLQKGEGVRAWQQLCAAAGIDRLPLCPAAVAPQTPSA